VNCARPCSPVCKRSCAVQHAVPTSGTIAVRQSAVLADALPLAGGSSTHDAALPTPLDGRAGRGSRRPHQRSPRNQTQQPQRQPRQAVQQYRRNFTRFIKCTFLISKFAFQLCGTNSNFNVGGTPVLQTLIKVRNYFCVCLKFDKN